MNFLKLYLPGIVILFSLGACSIFKENKEQEAVTQIALAEDVEPELYQDTTKVTFESFFKEIEESAGVEEVDLDALYASFENVPDESLPVFTTEQIAAQVNAMSSSVNINYHSEIQEYINRLTSKRGRKYMSKMLALSQLYFPIFEQILVEEGVPKELKYAAVVESALIPNIMSRAGAVGLWQFMYGTGKQYNLEINGNVDQRCDILASTRASARYMRSLYEEYKDWLLVLAAYNCGPGNVNKAIRKSGGGTDFWSIYQHLPKETRRHIPKYIATYYTFYYHRDLMIAPMRDMVKYTDVRSVEVDKPIHLGQVATVLGLEEKDLAELNRSYLKGYVPAKNKSYSLLLPAFEAGVYETYQDSIYAHDRSSYFSKNGKFVAKKKKFYPAYGTVGNGRRIVYRIRRGDYLGKIAGRFGTSVRKIKRWNGLRSDRIREGQRLVLYVSGRRAVSAAKQNSYRAKHKTKPNVKLPYRPDRYMYHTVQKNENCWSIAQKYEGVTQDSIMELNKITNPSGLRVGQKLRIKEKG